MAWSILQSNSAATTGAVSQAVAYTSNVSSGTKLIAYVASIVAQTGVQDNHANAFTQKAAITNASIDLRIWVLDTPAGDVGTAPTITATCGGSTFISIVVEEVSGLAAETGSLDGTPGTNSGNSSSTGTPAYSSSAANEFLVSVVANYGNAATTPAGYTADPANQNAASLILDAAYKNSTGGTETDGWSWSASAPWNIILGAFKLAGAAGVSGSSPSLMAARTEVISRVTGRVVRL